ncbi:MAG: hypothetical protein RBS55_07615 [Bacteroidales bacterium]|jgi:hypothetical protein|nr:hypothetical protein [Bacteroidales bacterium]
MTAQRFLISGFLTSLINLLLHGLSYALILKDFYHSFPAGSEEFIKQLHRGPDQLIGWAMAATALTMGYFITLIIKWSGARTFLSGLKYSSIAGILFWASVNFGLYASSNMFSLPAVFVDLACSAAVMTLAGASAAWMLGYRKTS